MEKIEVMLDGVIRYYLDEQQPYDSVLGRYDPPKATDYIWHNTLIMTVLRRHNSNINMTRAK